MGPSCEDFTTHYEQDKTHTYIHEKICKVQKNIKSLSAKKMEKHCTSYGLPARGDNVIVARVIS